VQRAHQKAIIHRDLKPSNILVVDINRKPMPRINDFGAAKATAHDLNADSVYTHARVIVGTIGYMSPEQADSASRDIDTRADVYSLGVVLYKFLVGVCHSIFTRSRLVKCCCGCANRMRRGRAQGCARWERGRLPRLSTAEPILGRDFRGSPLTPRSPARRESG
jgi:serine/threonine protein kinase